MPRANAAKALFPPSRDLKQFNHLHGSQTLSAWQNRQNVTTNAVFLGNHHVVCLLVDKINWAPRYIHVFNILAAEWEKPQDIKEMFDVCTIICPFRDGSIGVFSWNYERECDISLHRIYWNRGNSNSGPSMKTDYLAKIRIMGQLFQVDSYGTYPKLYVVDDEGLLHRWTFLDEKFVYDKLVRLSVSPFARMVCREGVLYLIAHNPFDQCICILSYDTNTNKTADYTLTCPLPPRVLLDVMPQCMSKADDVICVSYKATTSTIRRSIGHVHITLTNPSITINAPDCGAKADDPDDEEGTNVDDDAQRREVRVMVNRGERRLAMRYTRPPKLVELAVEAVSRLMPKSLRKSIARDGISDVSTLLRVLHKESEKKEYIQTRSRSKANKLKNS